MTWLKLGDEYPDDCAEVGLSDAAFRLHTEGLSWVMKRETDGLIRRHELHRLNAVQGDTDDALKELVGHGFWVEVDDPAGWLVLHQMKHQRTAEQIEKERERWRSHKATTRKGGGRKS